MLGIGIETSCDESSVAIVEDGTKCLSNSIFSQIKEHASFGGVVPEIASRTHLEKINFVYQEALSQAGLRLEDLDYIAVTVQPGLVGSLMVGASFAKCLGIVTGLPVVRVDHLAAHLYAPCLEGWRPAYPFLGLLLSGGNSAIYIMKEAGVMEVLGDTLDDACGEAFDKIAALLGLDYPGGPSVEKKADEYLEDLDKEQKTARQAAKPIFSPLLKKLTDTEIAFSFSGIKTAVMQAHNRGVDTLRICYDFQNIVFELVERNLIKAYKQTAIKTVLAGGGVLANDNLRKRLERLSTKNELNIIYPRNKVYCTDNAAMVAALAYFMRHTEWETRDMSFAVDSKQSALSSHRYLA